MAPYLGMFERASYFQWCICEPTWALKWDWSLIRQELPLEGVFQSGVFEAGGRTPLTLAIWSNLPKSSLSMSTNSFGEHSLASRVKPTMSAYSTLGRADRISGARVSAHTPSLPATLSYLYLTP